MSGRKRQFTEERLSVRLPTPLLDALRAYAKENDMEWSAACRQILKRGLAAVDLEKVYPAAPAGVPRRRVLSKGVG